ncbi:ImmA/IrrE family metallo-endopeptidase [Streptococcus pluranimalium]
MNLSEIIKSIERENITIIFTSLPNSKGRHDEINGQKFIFIDNELTEVEMINVLLHEKSHCTTNDINNRLSYIDTYQHHIENKAEKDRISNFMNLVNQEYPIDQTFNYIEYMKNAMIPNKYESFVKNLAQEYYLENSQKHIL